MAENKILSIQILNFLETKNINNVNSEDYKCSNDQDQLNSPNTSSSLTLIPQISENFSSGYNAAVADAQFASLLSSGYKCSSEVLINDQLQPCFEAVSPQASEDNISQGLITSRDHLNEAEDFSGFCKIEKRILSWLEKEGIQHVLPSEKIEKFFDEKRKRINSQVFTPIHKSFHHRRQQSGSIDCLNLLSNSSIGHKMSLPDKFEFQSAEDCPPQSIPNPQNQQSTSLWHRRKQQAKTVAIIPQSYNDLNEQNINENNTNSGSKVLPPCSLMNL